MYHIKLKMNQLTTEEIVRIIELSQNKIELTQFNDIYESMPVAIKKQIVSYMFDNMHLLKIKITHAAPYRAKGNVDFIYTEFSDIFSICSFSRYSDILETGFESKYFIGDNHYCWETSDRFEKLLNFNSYFDKLKIEIIDNIT